MRGEAPPAEDEGAEVPRRLRRNDGFRGAGPSRRGEGRLDNALTDVFLDMSVDTESIEATDGTFFRNEAFRGDGVTEDGGAPGGG